MQSFPSVHPSQAPSRRSVPARAVRPSKAPVLACALPPALFERVAGLYLRDAPGVVDDILGAVKRGDAQGLARGAHRLKSSSALVGARDVSSLCSELEHAGQHGDLAGAPRLAWALEERFAWTIEALASAIGERRGVA